MRRWTGSPVTTLLIGVCILVFVRHGASLSTEWGLTPSDPRPVTWITSAFLHTSLGHLVTNMVALFAIGGALETDVGSGRFTLITAASVAGASAAVVAWSPASSVTVGASGAIFGMLGALALYRRSRPVWIMLFVSLIWSIVPGVSWQAHVGGLLAGILAALILSRPPEPEPLVPPSPNAQTRM